MFRSIGLVGGSALAMFSLALIGACTQDFGQFGIAGCIRGSSQPCAGDGDCQGFQVCGDDGTFGPCSCEATVSSSAGSGGASASSSSSAGGATGASASASSSSGMGGGQGTGGAGGGAGVGAGGMGGARPCGNGVIDAGEACDDGNSANDDGCASDCSIEGNPDACATGVTIDLSPPGIVLVEDTNNGANHNDTDCGGNSALDMTFRFLPTQTGTVDVELVGNYNKVLAVQPACSDSGNEVFCDNSSGDLIAGDIAVTQNEEFHVVVTGFGGQEGAFTLSVTYQ